LARVSTRPAGHKVCRKSNGSKVNGYNHKEGVHRPAEVATREKPLPLDPPAVSDDDDGPTDDELAQEHEDPGTGNDDHIDDPVRIYLMQMGEIPLLNRRDEISAAKRIERSRRLFRHCMLATDFVLQAAMGLLEKVRDGGLRLDRTVEVSVTNLKGKRHIQGLLEPNLRTLRHLLRRDREDFRAAISRRRPMR
jgi:RNA polymerase primary sigma factor